jgi:hypothetical protein
MKIYKYINFKNSKKEKLIIIINKMIVKNKKRKNSKSDIKV